jgi:hypothetical protein
VNKAFKSLLAIVLFVQCSLCVAKTEFDKVIDFCASIASTYETNHAQIVFGKCYVLLCKEKCLKGK